ncbi:hypothetical protein [Bermanella sp. R86510]|uniref:hypothetical protein n=1 Tax=unclassified Bermanella TaxID=2627862 RepID=UPI0037C508DB
MMHKRILIKRFVLVTVLIQILCAWTVAPLPKDVTSTIDGLVSCSSEVPTAELDSSVFVKEDAPKNCHRWGLKWGFYQPNGGMSLASVRGMDPPEDDEDVSQGVDWQLVLWAVDVDEEDDDELRPSIDGDSRLPTIKELVRIFNYDSDPDTKSNAGVPVTDQVFRSWLQANGNASDVLDGYLISSTYRHINSTSGSNGEMRAPYHAEERYKYGDGPGVFYKRARVLGVEIGTGKVVSFNGHLELCESLAANAVCNTPVTEVNVYAFTVTDI